MMPANYRPSVLTAGAATVNAMMRGWEREDESRTDYTLQVVVEDEDRWSRRWSEDVVNAVNDSGKNVSPYRVHYRRQKNKAARKARRRNRRP